MKKWMTKEYVAEQAAKSDEAALLCSIEHYDQMLAASEKELIVAWRCGEVGIHNAHCALCQRHISSGACPMEQKCMGFCFDKWIAFAAAIAPFDNVVWGGSYNRLEGGDWASIRAAMLEVRRVLQEKYDELYPKKSKPEGFEPITYCCLRISVDNSNRILLNFYDTDHTCTEHPASIRKIIKSLQSAADYCETKRAKKCKPEVFYRRGMKFKGPYSDKYMLAYMGQSPKGKQLAGMSNMDDGASYHGPREVENCERITEAEFAKICDGGVFTLIEE